MDVLAITRDPQFSPNSVENDLAIMQAVTARLQRLWHSVTMIPEEEIAGLTAHYGTDTWMITMGRLPQTVEWLRRQDARTINTADAVAMASSRSLLTQMMQRNHLPMPPLHGDKGYWLKRGDASAQQPEDVVYCPTETDLNTAIDALARRGIRDYVVSAHVEGDLLKFYGVRGTGFFRYHYPTDDGLSKFGDERHNGTAHHYPFALDAMRHDIGRLAALVGIDVYGGDCIVRPDGSYCIIDFNDWPSFSRCREQAAEAIVKLITGEI